MRTRTSPTRRRVATRPGRCCGIPRAAPAPDAFKRVDPPIDPATGLPVNIWCSGTSFLADGRVLVTGGNLSYIDNPGDQYAGLNQVYTFNPFTETWTRQPDMAHGRWYPGQLLMPDGRTLIINGLDETKTGARNTDVDIFDPGAGAVGTVKKQGTLTGSFVGDYYPHMFWMPDGRGLIAGPNTNDSWTFANPGSGTIAPLDNVPNLQRTRTWGTAVLLPSSTPGTASSKILEIGGSDTSIDYYNAFASTTTELFDEANPGAGWQPQPSQNIARSHANTVLLPDGSMVTIGGGVGNDSNRNQQWTANPDQMQVELWDPTTKQWTLGPAQLENRAYHSTAILLPDGRVLSAGDDRNGGYDRDTAEIYEPAYLFKGTRPTITSAPTQLQYTTTFDVQTPNTNITKAVLIAPSAATHALNTNQRYVPPHPHPTRRRHHSHRPPQPQHRPPRLLHALHPHRPRHPLHRHLGQTQQRPVPPTGGGGSTGGGTGGSTGKPGGNTGGSSGGSTGGSGTGPGAGRDWSRPPMVNGATTPPTPAPVTTPGQAGRPKIIATPSAPPAH